MDLGTDKKQLQLQPFFATFMSVVFHPLIITTYLMLLIAIYLPSLLAPWTDDGKYMLIWIVFTGTFLMPLVLIFLLFNTKEVKSVDLLLMRNNKSRTLPFILTGVVYIFLTAVLYKQLRVGHTITVLLGSAAVSIVFTGIISHWWKISAHAIGIGSALGFLIMLNQKYADGDLFNLILGVIITSGILLSARLYLNEHQSLEVYTGWIFGIGLSMASMFIFT